MCIIQFFIGLSEELLTQFLPKLTTNIACATYTKSGLGKFSVKLDSKDCLAIKLGTPMQCSSGLFKSLLLSVLCNFSVVNVLLVYHLEMVSFTILSSFCLELD